MGLILIGEVVAILWIGGAMLRLATDGPDTAVENDVVGAGARLG
jgi:hypothetical protein